jgi:hypothetical protein
MVTWGSPILRNPQIGLISGNGDLLTISPGSVKLFKGERKEDHHGVKLFNIYIYGVRVKFRSQNMY